MPEGVAEVCCIGIGGILAVGDTVQLGILEDIGFWDPQERAKDIARELTHTGKTGELRSLDDAQKQGLREIIGVMRCEDESRSKSIFHLSQERIPLIACRLLDTNLPSPGNRTDIGRPPLEMKSSAQSNPFYKSGILRTLRSELMIEVCDNERL